MNVLENIMQDLSHFNIKDVVGAFVILFVAVDIIGAIPIVLSLKDKGQTFSTVKVSLFSGIMMLAFLFIGEPMLNFFGVDISSFAVAGAIVLFVMAVEMIFGVQIFKDDGPSGSATIVPLVFPLFAGAATFTTILTLQADGYAATNIAIALLLNALMIYLMLRFVNQLERFFGKGGVYVLRKFFGVILLAISVKFFMANIVKIIETIGAALSK
ncbi:MULTISPECIES: MarC family protein [Porphyromonas]|uniref:MarC family protein n=1 Tax=Porphyromonas TaxID=836 RepID=UPI00051D8BFA|nr:MULTISPECIES: MarC family protein [Porphyromonas]KGL51546.1 membrane protein [Porphyromonas canoris]KGN67270.1 membrane protein [Porphyromonas sp. COT-108 OH1349]